MRPNSPRERLEGLTLVCFALEREAAGLRKRVQGDRRIAILVSGIGRKNAEASVRDFLSRHKPQQVFTCGFSGGLDPRLQIGDVLFQTPDERLATFLKEAGARPASFHGAERMVITADEKTELWRVTGKDAVEMESVFIQALCAERRIACATVRSISDIAGESLPLDFNQLSKPDASLHPGRLVRALVQSPAKIPALWKLREQCRVAARSLADVLASVVGPGSPPPQAGP